MTASLDARHHVRVGSAIFCTQEWVVRPDRHANTAAVHCPHNSDPLRYTRVRPTYRASYLLEKFRGI